MKGSEEIFQLINALTPAEKRHFRLYVSGFMQKRGNNYLRLFNAIDRQRKYDEAKLRRKIFPSPDRQKQFPVIKNFLYKLILESEHVYHARSTPSAEFHTAIHQAEILNEKGLRNQGKKIMDQIQQKVLSLEVPSLRLREMEARESYIRSTLPDPDTEGEIFFSRKKTFADTYREEIALRELRLRISSLINAYRFIRSREEQEMYSSIMNDPLLSPDAVPGSFTAAVDYHICHGLYLFAREDFNGSRMHFKKLTDLIESRPDYIKNSPSFYLTHLINLLLTEINTGDREGFFSTLEKILSVCSGLMKHPLFHYSGLQHSTSAYLTELDFYMTRGEFDTAVRRIPEIERRFEILKDNFSLLSKMETYYSIAYVYFGLGNYSKTLYYLNVILNTAQRNHFINVESWARILLLLTNYEMSNTEVLEYSVRSVYRFLRKRKQLYKLEDTLLRFIRQRLPKLKTPEDVKAAFRDLKAAMEKVQEDPYEKEAFVFDFIPWLESKITGRPFADILRENAGGKQE